MTLSQTCKRNPLFGASFYESWGAKLPVQILFFTQQYACLLLDCKQYQYASFSACLPAWPGGVRGRDEQGLH
jgi:hypothetical protein